MKCLLVDVVGDAMCSQRRRILDKSIAPREIACVRKTTRARSRANARGFVHEAVLQRRMHRPTSGCLAPPRIG
jgi:hypothetical protein